MAASTARSRSPFRSVWSALVWLISGESLPLTEPESPTPGEVSFPVWLFTSEPMRLAPEPMKTHETGFLGWLLTNRDTETTNDPADEEKP